MRSPKSNRRRQRDSDNELIGRSFSRRESSQSVQDSNTPHKRPASSDGTTSQRHKARKVAENGDAGSSSTPSSRRILPTRVGDSTSNTKQDLSSTSTLEEVPNTPTRLNRGKEEEDELVRQDQPQKSAAKALASTSVHGRSAVSPAAASAATEPEPDQLSDHNNDFCTTCRGGGKLVCCESCPAAFHHFCCNPPLDPDDASDAIWQCTACSPVKNPFDKQPKHLAKLVAYLCCTNPSTFLPPIEVAQQLSLDSRKRRKPQSSHVDTTCLLCKRSTTGSARISCSACSLVYHGECLTPPILQKPSSPWSCPMHSIKEFLQANQKAMKTRPLKLDFRRHRLHSIEDHEAAEALAVLKRKPVASPTHTSGDAPMLDAWVLDREIFSMTVLELQESVRQLRDYVLHHPFPLHKRDQAHKVPNSAVAALVEGLAQPEETPVDSNIVATLRKIHSGEVFFMEATHKPYIIATDGDATLRVGREEVVSERVRVEVLAREDDSFLVRNAGQDPIYVNGVECNADDGKQDRTEATVITKPSVIDVSGLEFFFSPVRRHKDKNNCSTS